MSSKLWGLVEAKTGVMGEEEGVLRQQIGTRRVPIAGIKRAGSLAGR